MKKHTKKQAPMQAKSVASTDLQRLKRNVAGMDIGAKSIFICAGTSNDNLQVFEVPSFTEDLEASVVKLKEMKVESVAMEATGIYWVVVYDMLEEAGIEAYLVNPRDVKAIPGKKTDVEDCQRIQQLHSYGLLGRSFRPDKDTVVLRTYARQRAMLVEQQSMQVNHMHKALVQMNIQIGHVVSDITGVTGMKIMRAIVGGEHDPLVLAKNRDYRCKSSEAQIAKSLKGNYKSEHLLALKHALEIYDVLQEKVEECEAALEKNLSAFIADQSQSATNSDTESTSTDSTKPIEAAKQSSKKSKKSTKRPYNFEVALYLLRMVGVDLTTIPGISEHTAMTIIAEIGFDMSRWKSPKHFASWLGLCPGNNISGGKNLGGRTKKTNNKLAQALRMAASTLRYTKTALGAFFRRLSSRIGLHKAITAVAHKLATIIYCMLRDKKNYNEIGGEVYEARYHERLLKRLNKDASVIGYYLAKIEDQPKDSSLAVQ